MPDPFKLSCHRCSIRLRVDGGLDELVQCNCSTYRRFGAIHLKRFDGRHKSLLGPLP